MSASAPAGKAYLVGAGPGDLGLVTLRARELLERADVVIYDYLCNPEMLQWAKPGAEKINAGKSADRHTLTQTEINALLVEKTAAGHQVVRLKGGDPYVFGRGGEEAQALFEAHLPFEVVPGVTSAIAGPAYAGIPVTHRDFVSSVTFVTGHEDPAKPDSALDWGALARLRGTKVFLMGVERLPLITQRLTAEGADPATPAALVRWGTTGRQETVEGTLGTIATLAEERQIKPPAVFVLGEVVRLRAQLNWFESRPLFGRRIVVTRTRKQAGVLTSKLRELGADVLEIPTIRVVSRPLDAARENELRDLGSHYDWLVFTSPNGVDFFFKHLVRIGADIRSLGTLQIAAVGPATAQKLAERLLHVARQPRVFTTEALAAAFTEEEARGRRFCLARGHLADAALTNHLNKLGGLVTEWTIYDTEPETSDENGARARFSVEGADWICFASSSAVENWHRLRLDPPPGKIPRIASIGPVTSKTLTRLEYSIAAEAETSTLDGLVAALLSANGLAEPVPKL